MALEDILPAHLGSSSDDPEFSINLTENSDNFEDVTALSDSIFSESKQILGGDSQGLNSESFQVYPEAVGKNWIEGVRKDTRALERWRNRTPDIADQLNIRGDAFLQCPLPHPNEYLSLPKENIKDNSETQNLFSFEAALSRIARNLGSKQVFSKSNSDQKLRLEIKNENSCMNSVEPDEALEHYCKQHAYSRARLLRTDRRALANELLERLDGSFDEAEILALSNRSDSKLISSGTSELAFHGFNTKAIKESECHKLQKSSEKINKNDQKSTFFPFATQNFSFNRQHNDKGSERRGPGEDPVIWKKLRPTDMHENLIVTPCAVFPPSIFSESRSSCVRKQKKNY